MKRDPIFSQFTAYMIRAAINDAIEALTERTADNRVESEFLGYFVILLDRES